MARCPACNAANPDGAKFCVACGGALATEGSSPAPRSPADAAPQTTVPGRPLSGAMQVVAEPRVATPVPAPAPAVMAAPLAGSLPRRAPGRLAAGALVDQKYLVERVLGEGGMGVVYLARDVNTGLHVVLKAIREELAHRADVRARTLAEGRALAHIDHPNVVHLNAVVADRDELWLVMQFIDGESLDQRISRSVEEGRPIPLDEALSIFRQIASGIAEAHREGVIHRDLKPANVLIRAKDSVAKVTDFGIAKDEADALAGRGLTKGIIGSLYYMSPEQVSGQRDLDKRVDIYALGIVLFEILVGRVPFDAESDRGIMLLHLQAPVPRVSELRRDIPPEVDALIQKACAKDRADRFSSCDELLAAIDGLARRAPSAPPVGGSTPPGAANAAGRAPAPATTEDDPNDPRRSTAARTGGTDRPPVPHAGAARRPWLAVGLGALAVGVVTGGALLGFGVLGPEVGRPIRTPEPARPDRSASPSASASAGVVAAPPASAAATPREPPPLEALVGVWIGNGRELEAVLAGEALEFRVRHPEQFAPQDYDEGEARFSLREIAGEPRAFAVEDRLRFIAPAKLTFDRTRARGTCQDVRAVVDGRPLRASFDGTRLSVEFAKSEASQKNFVAERDKVVSCVGLSSLPATRVVSTLSRP